jgi:hypothetical protein
MKKGDDLYNFFMCLLEKLGNKYYIQYTNTTLNKERIEVHMTVDISNSIWGTKLAALTFDGPKLEIKYRDTFHIGATYQIDDPNFNIISLANELLEKSKILVELCRERPYMITLTGVPIPAAPKGVCKPS